MAIPVEVANVIALARTQEREERILDELRENKASHQASIQALNSRITEQVAIVQAARAALKAAAQTL